MRVIMSKLSFDGFRFPSITLNRRKTIFNCPKLDSCITPSLRDGQIIEIVGKAGAGKTQVALSVCVGAAKQNKIDIHHCSTKSRDSNGVILFISTEGPFPITRLNEMVMEYQEGQSLMDSILIEQVADLNMLFDCLDNKIPQMLEHKKITLVVIDSIAGPLRSEYIGDDWKERTTTVHRLGSTISNIARKVNVPVIIVNQVTAYMDQPYESFGRTVVPCFGVAFSNYVNTRIFVTRTENVIKKTVASTNLSSEGKKNKLEANTRIRTLTIDFSPLLPSGNPIHFVVSKMGIYGVEISD